MLNDVEFKYIADFILKVAFPNIAFNYCDRIYTYNNYNIYFNLMDKVEYDKLIHGELKMNYINTYDNKFKVPIYKMNKSFVCISSNNITINADILTLPFLLLSRKEEKYINSFDKYNRFVYFDSLSHKYDIIDFPIIDEYAYILRKNLSNIFKDDFSSLGCNVILTHDIDTFSRFGNFYKNFKTIVGGDIISRHNLFYFFASLKELYLTKINKMNDPKIKSIIEFLNLSVKYRLDSHFFFLAYTEKDLDFRYNLNDYRISKVINLIRKNKKNVGLHIGLNASDNSKEFINQLNRLKKICDVNEARTHYLKFNLDKTISIYEQNDILYDYSFGYAEKSGFKCGTCHEFYLFDLSKNKVSNVIERPLIVMDGSLKDEENLSLEGGLNRMKKLYNNCKRVQGNFIVLWHPDSTIREWKIWYDKVFKKFLEESL